MDQVNRGLKDIFGTMLKDTTEASRAFPTIIILSGNGHVIAPGGTVHVHRSIEKSTGRDDDQLGADV